MNGEKLDFDKSAASWDEVPGRVKLASDIAAAIRDETVLTRDMDVLDFGCGTGLLTLPFASLVHSITGADSSQGMLDVLRAKSEKQHVTNVRTQYLDLDQGHALEGQYHLVYSTMTFHHIKEITPLLAQFSAVLLPDGYLCIADLDPDDGKFHADNTGVFHFGFDRAKLRLDLLEAGFDDVRDRTAATMVKPQPQGGEREFTVFLITARKRA
jgi:2-polyprenyl-3-methyl-5-hydroxy-6-metoxy-1,4-benzoquinol methylase